MSVITARPLVVKSLLIQAKPLLFLIFFLFYFLSSPIGYPLSTEQFKDLSLGQAFSSYLIMCLSSI